ncbi:MULTISPECIES: hypothetical protein [unclassified Myroides]|uniref:hypothetical protein n=1 Tax=unclassified Myroides TaxID=2642485 RepID=UPI00257589D3|nr:MULTISPECIES: hypothetical protein [unclassified Myroides]
MWLSVDPLAEEFPGWNPYHYVHNNPVNLVDPTGMSAEGTGEKDSWFSRAWNSFTSLFSSKPKTEIIVGDPELQGYLGDEGTPNQTRQSNSLTQAISDIGGGTQVMNTHSQAMDASTRSDGSRDWTAYAAHSLWLDKINNFGGDMGSAGTPSQSRTPKSIHWEGKTFSQYKAAYWATRTKPIYQPIRMSNGNVFKVYEELHHRFIPQRATWAPNWLKNNRLNLQPLNSIQHSIHDSYRFRFLPKEIKQEIKNGNTFGY